MAFHVGQTVYRAHIEEWPGSPRVVVHEARIVTLGKSQLKLATRESAWHFRVEVEPGLVAATKEGALAALCARCCFEVQVAEDNLTAAKKAGRHRPRRRQCGEKVIMAKRIGSRFLAGAGNYMWKGGRSVASNGYVLVRVGVGHHLADVRGYAYEHRLVAEKKLGRRLLPGEIVHHRDGNKQDNTPDNLQVEPSIAHHKVRHRSGHGACKRLPGEPNRTVSCACGCGATFLLYDASGRVRKYAVGHSRRKPRNP